jgi:hypothetical protein
MLGGYLKYLGFFCKKLELLIFGSLKTLKDMSGFMKELAIFLAVI